MTFLRAVIEVVYGTQDIWVGLPYVLIAGGVAIGGFFGVYLIIYGLDYLILGVERRTQWFRTTINGGWKKRPGRSWRNLRHLVSLTVFFSGLAFIAWVAGAAAGFNVWNSQLMLMTLGGITAYLFGPSLGNAAAGVALHFANALEVGQHWEFHGSGPGWDGVILTIGITDVEMQRWDVESSSVETVNVPMSSFNNQMRKRNDKKEQAAIKFQAVASEEYLLATGQIPKELALPPAPKIRVHDPRIYQAPPAQAANALRPFNTPKPALNSGNQLRLASVSSIFAPAPGKKSYKAHDV